MSIENHSPQSLEPRRGDMSKTFPLAGPFQNVKVILKSIIKTNVRHSNARAPGES